VPSMTDASALSDLIVRSKWHHEPVLWNYDLERDTLMMRAPASSDLIHEPLSGAHVTDAPMLIAPTSGNFALSAHAELSDIEGRWSAGILVLWQDRDHWAKLCLERSPEGVPSIITVVTNVWSDDGIHWPLEKDASYLRVLRRDDTFVMHASVDGKLWRFVRVFRFLGPENAVHAGFLVQSPWGNGCTATFSQVRLVTRLPADMRDGT
jgi:regulation of enolase protein 1 (concanavalin A-like superfamily)